MNKIAKFAVLLLLPLAARGAPVMPYGTYLVKGAFKGEYNTVLRDFGAAAGKVCDAVILIGEKPSRPIAEGVRSTGFPEEKLFVVPDLAAAKEILSKFDAGGRRKAVLFENNLPDNH